MPRSADAPSEACLAGFRDAHDWKFTTLACIERGAIARPDVRPADVAPHYLDARVLCRNAGDWGDLQARQEGVAAAAAARVQMKRAADLLGAAQAAHAAGGHGTLGGRGGDG